jgi:hypothetical protein
MILEELVTRDCLRKLATRSDTRVFRNQVGAYKLADGRYISSGLCPGSHDYIGWQSVKITPAMVGATIAVFTSIEFKSTAELAYLLRHYHELRIYDGADEKKKRFGQQINWCERIKKAGGNAGFAATPEQALKVLR